MDHFTASVLVALAVLFVISFLLNNWHILILAGGAVVTWWLIWRGGYGAVQHLMAVTNGGYR